MVDDEWTSTTHYNEKGRMVIVRQNYLETANSNGELCHPNSEIVNEMTEAQLGSRMLLPIAQSAI